MTKSRTARVVGVTASSLWLQRDRAECLAGAGVEQLDYLPAIGQFEAHGETVAIEVHLQHFGAGGQGEGGRGERRGAAPPCARNLAADRHQHGAEADHDDEAQNDYEGLQRTDILVLHGYLHCMKMPNEDDPEESSDIAAGPVADADSGTRLDRWLATHVAGHSRERLKALIQDGRVTRADGATVTDPSVRVKPGQVFAIAVPAPEPATPLAEKIPLNIVYEDDAVVVIDKPAGLVVHPAPGNPTGTLVNALLEHCGDSLSGIGGVRRPGIVHRLDKDTSGLLVVAKTDIAHRGLVEDFAHRKTQRVYRALVWGVPASITGTLEGRIGRSSRNRKKMAVVQSGGREALTRYKVVEAFGDLAAVVECRLGTGRTHQIRVHLADLGHPVIGDAVYGKSPLAKLRTRPAVRTAAETLGRQALHAIALGFHHPVSGVELTFRSEMPLELKNLIAKLRIEAI